MRMNETLPIICPYCGETMYVEPEPASQVVEYVEDCAVCCHPIVITIQYDPMGSQVSVRREND